MSIPTRSHKSISAQQGQHNLPPHGIRAAEARQHALGLLAGFDLSRPPEARFDAPSVLSVLLYAAAAATSLEHAGRALPLAPSPNTVRHAVQGLTVTQVETHLNDAGMTRPVAIDLKRAPSDGQPPPGEEDFVWHQQAQRGVTRFFVSATLYVIKKGRRFTLALRACRRSGGLEGAARWLEGGFGRWAGRGGVGIWIAAFIALRCCVACKQRRMCPFAWRLRRRGRRTGWRRWCGGKGWGSTPRPSAAQSAGEKPCRSRGWGSV